MSRMLTVEAVELSGSIGARVLGVDLRDELSPEVQQQLRDLFAARRLLVFPDQEITVDDQVRAVGVLGPVMDEFGDGTRNSLVSNIDADAFLTITERLMFHSDRTFTPHPLLGLSLYAMELSSTVTPTHYVDLAAAFRRLAPDTRALLVTRVATHMADFREVRYPDVRPLRKRLPDDLPLTSFPRQLHPIVLTHPATFDPVLMVSELMTVWIDDMDRSQSEQLLDEVFATLYDPEFRYVHHWQPNDLVIWDNLALQHGRDPLDPAERRRLRRVAMGRHNFQGYFEQLGEDKNRPGSGE
jgi:taurine dioxygenase